MRKFKKILAFSLASAMIVSAVPASAATANTAKAGKATIYYNGNASYKSTWVKTTTKKGYTVKFFNKTAKVATLDSKTGKVTAKKAGTAQVKVNFYKGGKYVGNKVVKIAVKKAPVGKGIKAEQTTLAVGETTKIVSSNGVKLNCYSADKKVVTVNKNTGVVTAVAPGTTKIAAVNAISGKKVYVEVTVNADLAAKQSGAKQITLTGSGFTKDTKVEVKKGNTVVAVDTAKQETSSDGKTLIVPTKNVITAGEYAVTVGDKTVKFNGEASKVTSIEVSDVAVVDKGVTLPITTNATASGATITYVVKDQFGADVTKTTNVTVNASRTKKSEGQGKIKVQLNAYDKKDDLISIVVIHTETGLSTTKNVKISDAAVVNEVTFGGVYNESKKELTEKENVANFYYLFDLVDQYGNSMVNKDFKVGTKAEDDLMLTINPGVTNVTLNTATKVSVIKKDGKDYIAVPFKLNSTDSNISAGKGTILAITKLGKTFNGEFEVKAGEKVDTFTAAPSDVVIAGKETVFDFTAVDTYGNDISAKATKEMFAKSTQDREFNRDSENGYFKFAKNVKTGKNELVFVAKESEQDKVFLASFITATNKVVTVQFTIKAGARPTGLSTADNFGMVSAVGRDHKIKASEVKVTNQYGTEFKFDKFGVEQAGYTLTVEKVDGDVVTVEAPVGASEAKFVVAKEAAGTATFKFVLKGKDANGQAKTYEEEFTVTTKALKDIVTSDKDVVITDMPKMHYASDRELEVKARINGADVTLVAGKDYKVITNTTVEGDKVSGGAIIIDPGKTEAAGKYSVVILNGLGIEVVKDVTVCKEAPKAASAKLKDTAEVVAGNVKVASVLGLLKVKDQYGADYAVKETDVVRVQFKDCSNKDKVAKENNTTASNIDLAAEESVTAVVTFPGGYVHTLTVVAKAATK